MLIHPLADPLSVLLPSPEQTLFLRACLPTGDAASAAWRAWMRRVGEPLDALKDPTRGYKPLLAMLAYSMQRQALPIDRALRSHLRAAALSEEVRAAAYRSICADTLATLGAAEVPCIVTGGGALADTAYPSAALRHAHDVDVLLREDDLDRASTALVRQGYSALGQGWGEPQSLCLTHHSGLPVALHTQCFPSRFYAATLSELSARSERRDVAGVHVHVLARADQLFHACGLAVCSTRRNALQWACDAWHVAQYCTPADWERFVASAQRSRLALPLAIIANYLAGELGGAVPAQCLDTLVATGEAASRVECEAAVRAARTAGGAGYRALLRRVPRWTDRVQILRWVLWPSASYLQSTGAGHPGWPLSLRQAARAWRYLARRAQDTLRQASR